jgi:hypothetical protein
VSLVGGRCKARASFGHYFAASLNRAPTPKTKTAGSFDPAIQNSNPNRLKAKAQLAFFSGSAFAVFFSIAHQFQRPRR